MATCKDCLHWKVCNEYRGAFWGHKAQYSSPIINASADSCIFYKDRSRFVELPCEVGDTVYCLAKPSKRRITKISITTYGLRLSVNDMFCFDESQIGKTVFLTREEAEQALKERESK